MREIKFRVWDKLANEYVAWNDFLNTRLVDNVFRGSKDMTLEQYTGLHDKNGKEIYEGDIVLWGDDSSRTNGTMQHVTVAFRGGCFGIYHRDYFSDFLEYAAECWTDKPIQGNKELTLEEYFQNCFEVIGNIHEGVG